MKRNKNYNTQPASSRESLAMLQINLADNLRKISVIYLKNR
jgi:hypothetical protein